MKNALFILPTDKVAGAEGVLKKIALELRKRSYNVTIIFLSRGNNGTWFEFESSHITYINSPRESIGFLKALLVLFNLRLRGIEYEYTITSHIHCNAFVGFMKKMRLIKTKKCIYRESTTPFSWYVGARLQSFRLMYKFYNKPNIVICQTAKMKTELIKNVPVFCKLNLQVIPNPVDYVELRYQLKNSLTERKCEEANSNEIVSVGRLVPEKGFKVLLEAFAKLLKTKPHYILRIIGSGPDKDKLESFAISTGVYEKVIFHGHSSNPLFYMHRAKLCVVSSVIEGFPNVLLEKMSVARRVVSTLCADGVEKLPGIYKCSVNDFSSLANSMEAALDSPYKVYSKNIREMRHHVKLRGVNGYVDQIIRRTNVQN